MALSNRLSCLAYDNKHHKISYFVDEKNHKDVMYVEFDNLKFDFTKVLSSRHHFIESIYSIHLS
jgi:hypothetical protein